MDTHALAGWLGRQRWFAGKGREWRVAGTSTLAWLQREPPAVRILVATVAYADGEAEAYQLALVHYDHPVHSLSHAFIGEDSGSGEQALGYPTWVYDALHVKDVTGLWLRAIAEEATLGELPGADQRPADEQVAGPTTPALRFHRDPAAAAVPLDAPSLVMGAEQSNTSLVFGDVAILKVFRKLAPGINPDIELHTALARAGSTDIAQPYGWVEGSWTQTGVDGPDTVRGALAMLQQYLRNATDGWDLARASVRDLLAERDLHADEVGGDFAAEAHRLGVVTAQVHSDLARALPTGEATATYLAEQAAAMGTRLGRAAGDVPELAPYAEALRRTYDALPGLPGPVPLQRIHGDYHLGQVMRTPEGWKVLDFEGEPAKPLEARRALDSPLRDVAGMVRSFDYAARHMLMDGPWDPQRDYRAGEWAQRNTGAFRAGYAEGSQSLAATGAAGGQPGVRPDTAEVLLRAYEIDKAVYEVVYEARNRPGWVRIPLAAVERLAQSSSGRSS